MAPGHSEGQRVEPIDDLIARLSREQLGEIAATAAARHEDVAQMLRLVAARGDGDLTVLRTAVDDGLRTRRFLDYHESIAWAQAAQPTLAELDAMADAAPSRELVELLQRAVGHVVKVILRADDSTGSIGDVAQRLLVIHAKTCAAGVADPVRLAGWMIRFRFRDQDLFEVDPVRYAPALGDRGLAAYRKAIAEASTRDAFAVRYARERLAVLDRDPDAIVALAGGELTNAFQFRRVAELMAEIDRPDLVLTWTQRGIAETNGRQIGVLYDLACDTYGQLDQPLEVLRLRRAHHERMASSTTYGALRAAAETLDTWDRERDAARRVLRERDTSGYVQALLADGEDQLAWQAATAAPPGVISERLWLALAEHRETTGPSEALAVYLRIADEILIPTDRSAYAKAIRILKRARRAAEDADASGAFARHIAHLREQHRRRPTLIAMLDKAKLTGD